MLRFMKSLIKKPLLAYMNLKITHKLLIGYFIIVLIPTFTLEWSFYRTSYHAFQQNHQLNQQHSLEIAKQNFEIQLKQISSLTSPFENSRILTNYLYGKYTSASDALFYYYQYISPLYTASKINPYLENLTIYGYMDYPFNLKRRLTTIDDISVDDDFIEKLKKDPSGIWRFSIDNNTVKSLDFYKMLYSSTYPFFLGIIKIETKLPQTLYGFNSLYIDDLYLHDYSNNLLYQYNGKSLSISTNQLDSLYQNNKHYQTTEIPAINCMVIQFSDSNLIMNYDGTGLITLLVLLFLVLTALYYLVTSSISRRLRAFSNYVNQIDANNPKDFPNNNYNDEIGVVITAHNNMLNKVIQLTKENYQSQLEKRDAEYYALQAQIKPHFLYNMLENIRMSAEAHNDPETADMLLSLGKHMRYSLNMKAKTSNLVDELYFAKNYLQDTEDSLKR